ncbi:hypothetical protein SAMN05519103_08490 [Rhizobiales bacterium GAS113]|nr:hypothetical protein SAMN05519103_08490 [Rhizobiales bacterium GAS113]
MKILNDPQPQQWYPVPEERESGAGGLLLLTFVFVLMWIGMYPWDFVRFLGYLALGAVGLVLAWKVLKILCLALLRLTLPYLLPVLRFVLYPIFYPFMALEDAVKRQRAALKKTLHLDD